MSSKKMKLQLQTWKATHRITFTPTAGAPVVYEVMLIEEESTALCGPAYTKAEWNATARAAWEMNSDGTWFFMGETTPGGESGEVEVKLLAQSEKMEWEPTTGGGKYRAIEEGREIEIALPRSPLKTYTVKAPCASTTNGRWCCATCKEFLQNNLEKGAHLYGNALSHELVWWCFEHGPEDAIPADADRVDE